MPIRTTVTGDPSAVFAAAEWIRGTLARAVTDTADRVFTARNRADSGWQGTAGEAFRDTLTRGGQLADELVGDADGIAARFDEVAASLRWTQREMRRIRTEAVAAGLPVTERTVEEPGPLPPDPGPAPMGSAATPDALRAHAEAVTARQNFAARQRVYEKLRVEAEVAHAEWSATGADINNTAGRFLRKNWPTIGSSVVAAGESVANYDRSIKSAQAGMLGDEAALRGSWAERAWRAGNRGEFERLLGRSEKYATRASTASDDVAAYGKTIGRAGLAFSGALTVGAVAYDMSNGESAAQAVSSNGVGLASSVVVSSAVSGALAGTAVGGPVGFAVGAIAGVAAGAITSGAVDHAFENGSDDVGRLADDAGEVLDSGVDDARGIVSGLV
ncbi:hypothetical protein SAMN04487819_11188 [Actinopolyspora alba]|uniref:Uncharacterized protein n=1 Tax=Actinopolyspora alba TaxID=673379 RepID=A0A1I1ZQ91_9ACTN|nr:hypothetical protein [Actinopolyspora alba]SFE33792.1 hypothetical protein SAMN04487819_11188 [Actinopolyspora alba]